MAASPRWTWACALGWIAVLGAGPWLGRAVWEDASEGGAPEMQYVACAAAALFVLGVVLGRVRAWAPSAVAGVVGVVVMTAASGTFDDPARGLGDPSGFAVMMAAMLAPLVLLALVMGACIGSLLGPPRGR